MKDKTLKEIVEFRQQLIRQFEKLRDYKQNPNALMKERDHAATLNDVIKKIDTILAEYVTFT